MEKGKKEEERMEVGNGEKEEGRKTRVERERRGGIG